MMEVGRVSRDGGVGPFFVGPEGRLDVEVV